MSSYWFSEAHITKYHNLDALRQQKVVLETRNPKGRCRQAYALSKTLEDSLPLASLWKMTADFGNLSIFHSPLYPYMPLSIYGQLSLHLRQISSQYNHNIVFIETLFTVRPHSKVSVG